MADLTRGVLLAGRFRTFEELNRMSHDDQRNTLITVLVGLTQPVAGEIRGRESIKRLPTLF